MFILRLSATFCLMTAFVSYGMYSDMFRKGQPNPFTGNINGEVSEVHPSIMRRYFIQRAVEERAREHARTEGAKNPQEAKNSSYRAQN